VSWFNGVLEGGFGLNFGGRHSSQGESRDVSSFEQGSVEEQICRVPKAGYYVGARAVYVKHLQREVVRVFDVRRIGGEAFQHYRVLSRG
jgi:hypothetical protein